MRFLADESCDFAVVRALRAAGHDVVAIAELFPGAKDRMVIGLAQVQERVLLTEDKDFGQLVYASGAGSSGAVLFRFPANARRRLGTAAIEAANRLGEQLQHVFAAVEPGRVRVGGPAAQPEDV